jgi:predicted XRE-type DNA-binding protein
MSKLNKLPVKNEVIHQLAIGETQTSIAEQVGVRQPTISRFANKDEIKA